AFGNLLSHSGASDNNRLANTKERDESTGLYFHGARYYDPETGRYISVDPARDGDNFYAYANNNPLGFIDPLGLAPSSCAGPGGLCHMPMRPQSPAEAVAVTLMGTMGESLVSLWPPAGWALTARDAQTAYEEKDRLGMVMVAASIIPVERSFARLAHGLRTAWRKAISRGDYEEAMRSYEELQRIARHMERRAPKVPQETQDVWDALHAQYKNEASFDLDVTRSLKEKWERTTHYQGPASFKVDEGGRTLFNSTGLKGRDVWTPAQMEKWNRGYRAYKKALEQHGELGEDTLEAALGKAALYRLYADDAALLKGISHVTATAERTPEAAFYVRLMREAGLSARVAHKVIQGTKIGTSVSPGELERLYFDQYFRGYYGR
ncbi:MAG: RHS repeat-associated core domain-containing protein, partial [Verrucomicrobia bacterium]|nr:RHS repeat-associated core domain-containing protein [Verrucomicrobiota bacterium]